jgi:SRSO17 transposase
MGLQRQYIGAAGKTEDCQVGVFLTYVGPQGRTFLDRRLYLPDSWAEDSIEPGSGRAVLADSALGDKTLIQY